MFKSGCFVLFRFGRTTNSGLFKAFYQKEKGQKNKFKYTDYLVTIP